ncbi:glycosyltransferase family 58 protein [Gloeophyllum trabeum ATCC 11539]|uniref:Dol-P-Man:Man(5)GlcNAc(2)-PP-Dol alpha-1,3-mannosyltransferase n=1 Tax=Gloeophyllum trabeum (strain ATCC 11539 / FP-39264 / Madison 617) TaxID=670483 RepID=S7QG84_GLOTA|nr:glycosyltransferase family 58 protein [Gloeophyllum trabeum ATCC 11539]EPQ58193.1 glycosyltransferase family 58 protein [Gloeophyllum trabeum ATCC 11539]
MPLLPKFPPGASPPWPKYLWCCLRLLLTEPAYIWLLASPVIFVDAIVTQLIIRYIPYTEIDWRTYMSQVELYIKGVRDYSLIEGPTGPLVYPAGHVYVHEFLYLLTGKGSNVGLSQQIYALLYILSLIIMCSIYRQTRGVPNWLVLLLPLSKRLHSIFVLRLFNDCWSVVAVEAAVLAYQRGRDDLGTILFSAALSVKMSALLFLPGVLVILFKRHGLLQTLRHVALLMITQVLIASPFLVENSWAYTTRAFEFSRVFLYRWTVNWRFVDETTFLSPGWARGLLLGHITVLCGFGLVKWCRRDGGVWAILSRGLRRPTLPAHLAPVTADHVATILFTSNLIGILFARSLHYQFYAWYAQQLPFLAWRTRYPIALKIGLLMSIEYCWNVYPSTPLSSGLLALGNAALVVGIWFGYSEGKDGR